MDRLNINSSVEEKAEECRNRLTGRAGKWAFEYEEEHYCFMGGEQPPCALDESRILERMVYSAGRWQREIDKFHICGMRI